MVRKYYCSLFSDREQLFFDPHYFSWALELENNWQTIRQELDVVLESVAQLPGFHDISPDQQRLSGDGLTAEIKVGSRE